MAPIVTVKIEPTGTIYILGGDAIIPTKFTGLELAGRGTVLDVKP